MKAILALYLAQAREFLRDRMSVLFVLLLPVAFGVFFGLVFSSGGGFSLQLGIANEDVGPVGAGIVSGLEEGSQGLDLHLGTREQLRERLNRGEVHVVMVLPAGLSASVEAGRPTQVEVLYDPGNPASEGIGLGMVRTLLGQANLALSGAPLLLAPHEIAAETHPLRSIDFYMPGMLAVALLWLGVFGTAQPVVVQREAQVFRRLRVTPVSRLAMLTAEVAWRVSVGLLQAATFLLVGWFGFGVGVQQWLPFLGTVLLGTMTFVGLGYALAGVGRSAESTMAVAQMINFPMMMLSGSIFSADMLPSFFRPIVNALPLTYLSDLLRQTMVGASPVHPMGVDFLVLGGWLVVMLVLAVRLWRWE